MANNTLGAAKKAKNDEFYTQYGDIQIEIEAYLEFDKNSFKGKVVYCNCDDPFESNFFRFFALNFNRLGIKQLITTSYKPSPIANTQLGLFGDDITIQPLKGRPKVTANKLIINEVHDMDGDGAFNLQDIAEQLKANKNNEWAPLEGDGSFSSDECIELLKQSDIVVTNPPFSLFRPYMQQLIDYKKKFVVIGSMNAIKYKEIFPLIQSDKMWLGNGFHAGNAYFSTPNVREFASGVYDEKTGLVKFRNCHWFTNLDHGRRHQPLGLMSMAENLKFNKKMAGKLEYDHYDNYDAIDVPFTNAIPSDYEGIMGVPISFLDKYSPEQFEIIWQASGNTRASAPQEILERLKYKKNSEDRGGCTLINNRRTYDRIFIKHRKANK